jgi:hypothetical protein
MHSPVLFSPTMRNSEPVPFSCPSCQAEYKIVTIEAPREAQHAKSFLEALFPSGDEGVFFKYFLVSGRPSRRKPR